MKKLGILGDKTYSFAIRIINAYKFLSKEGEYVLSKQLLRSGTAIGALCREAQNAQSKADFLNKMNIALKEANETEYWLSLLKDTNYIEEKIYQSIYSDCDEIVRILTKTVITIKKNIEKEKSEK